MNLVYKSYMIIIFYKNAFILTKYVIKTLITYLLKINAFLYDQFITYLVKIKAFLYDQYDGK